MALIVVFSNDYPFPQKQKEIHIPISFELSMEIRKHYDSVEKIMADGHEHDFLTQRFKNIPHGHASTTWSGEWARFIAENFPH